MGCAEASRKASERRQRSREAEDRLMCQWLERWWLGKEKGKMSLTSELAEVLGERLCRPFRKTVEYSTMGIQHDGRQVRHSSNRLRRKHKMNRSER